MEEIIVQVKDKDKVHLLTDLLQALDFISSVRVQHRRNGKRLVAPGKSSDEFFALAGLWAERDVNLPTIRQQAWPRQQQ